MFSLKGRKDNFKFLFPNEFIAEEINDKYAKVLQDQHSFMYKPIDFINETIRSIQVLGFNDATIVQRQPGSGNALRNPKLQARDSFLFPMSDIAYRSEVNPLQLIDKTFNVTFRHTLGYINYFILFENFWYIYHRDTENKELPLSFNIEFMDAYGRTYAKVCLERPIINSMDMLSLDYTAPVATSDTFQISFKYSNIDYQFLDIEKE